MFIIKKQPVKTVQLFYQWKDIKNGRLLVLIAVLNQIPDLKSNMMLTLFLAGKQNNILYSPFLLPDLQDKQNRW